MNQYDFYVECLNMKKFEKDQNHLVQLIFDDLYQ